MDKKLREVRKNYSFCKSLVFAIQAITGEKTHDILGTLVSKADDTIKANEIEVTKEISTGWFKEIKCRDYIYYPGTKLYLGIYVIVNEKVDYTNNYNSKIVYNKVSYSFKLPQSYVKLDQQKFDDIALDGILTNTSFDFDKPIIKRPKTPAERKKEKEDKAALAKAKRNLKKNARKLL